MTTLTLNDAIAQQAAWQADFHDLVTRIETDGNIEPAAARWAGEAGAFTAWADSLEAGEDRTTPGQRRRITLACTASKATRDALLTAALDRTGMDARTIEDIAARPHTEENRERIRRTLTGTFADRAAIDPKRIRTAVAVLSNATLETPDDTPKYATLAMIALLIAETGDNGQTADRLAHEALAQRPDYQLATITLMLTEINRNGRR